MLILRSNPSSLLRHCRFLSSVVTPSISTEGGNTTNNIQNVKKQSSDLISVEEKKFKRNNQMGVIKDGLGQVYAGFNYLPRFPGQEDPPYEPSKVFMVQRIRSLKRKPYWDKEVFAALGLDGKSSQLAIVANTPASCAMLWKVKHLIRVTPISLPQGLPEDGDLSGARLQENGELRFIPKIKNAVQQLEEASPSNKDKVTIMNGRMEVSIGRDDIRFKREFLNGPTVARHLRLKWLKPWN